MIEFSKFVEILFFKVMMNFFVDSIGDFNEVESLLEGVEWLFMIICFNN